MKLGLTTYCSENINSGFKLSECFQFSMLSVLQQEYGNSPSQVPDWRAIGSQVVFWIQNEILSLFDSTGFWSILAGEIPFNLQPEANN